MRSNGAGSVFAYKENQMFRRLGITFLFFSLFAASSAYAVRKDCMAGCKNAKISEKICKELCAP